MDEDKDVKDMSLGERIRLVRGKRTPAEFGLLISKHKQNVILFEANVDMPSLATLAKIAKAGNVTVDWLFYGTPTQ